MPKNLDLFGGETEKNPQTLLGRAGYRTATPTEKADGKTCKQCKHRTRQYGYYKCKLISLSHSMASDIRLKGTCNKWEQEIPELNIKEDW